MTNLDYYSDISSEYEDEYNNE